MPTLKIEDSFFEPIEIEYKGKKYKLTTLTRKVMQELNKADEDFNKVGASGNYEHMKIFFPDIDKKEVENMDQRWVSKIVRYVLDTLKKQFTDEEKKELRPEEKKLPS